MKICQLYFLLNCVCSLGFAGLDLLKGEESGLGLACSIRFVGWGLLVLVYLVGLQSGVCKVGFAQSCLLGLDLWSGFTGRGKVGFVKWILQSRVCGMGLAGWSFLSGGY